ncbi:MAG: TolC family protein [Bacteroidetes bacterium]|nr:TolC family protein [Bacteroidota bacterium]
MNIHWAIPGWRMASLFIVCVLAFSTTRAQSNAYATPDRQPAVYALTAKEAVAFARKNNILVKKALQDVLLQQQVNREVTASALPQVDGSLNYTNNLKLPVSLLPAEFFGGTPGTYIPIKFGVQHTSTIGATLNQVLFDGQVFVGLQAREASMDYARKAAEITEETVAVNVYKVYYQLLIAHQQLNLYHENIVRFEKLYHDTREIYKNGFAEQLDVDKVNVTLTNLRTDSIKLRTQINTGFLGLKMLMGIPMRDSIVQSDVLTGDMLKKDILDTAFRYDDRREFQLLQIGKRLNEYNVKRYKYSYLPSLSGFGQYFTNAQRNSFDFFKSGGDWFQQGAVGIRLSVPIFDGFRRDAQIKQARFNVQKIDLDIENTKLQIDNDVAAAWQRMRDAVIAVDAQKENVALAEKVYEQTKKKYEQGLGSNTEINTAQTEMRTAQTNFFSSLYDATIARIDYLKATGKILNDQ